MHIISEFKVECTVYGDSTCTSSLKHQKKEQIGESGRPSKDLKHQVFNFEAGTARNLHSIPYPEQGLQY